MYSKISFKERGFKWADGLSGWQKPYQTYSQTVEMSPRGNCREGFHQGFQGLRLRTISCKTVWGLLHLPSSSAPLWPPVSRGARPDSWLGETHRLKNRADFPNLRYQERERRGDFLDITHISWWNAVTRLSSSQPPWQGRKPVSLEILQRFSLMFSREETSLHTGNRARLKWTCGWDGFF